MGDEIEVWSISAESPGHPDPPLEHVKLRFFPQRPRDTLATKLESAISPLPTFAWVQRSREVLEAFSKSPEFDVAVVDHAHSGSLAPELDAGGIRWEFDAANVESSVLKQISERVSNPVTRARFALDAWKFQRLEADLVARAAAAVAVSAGDARKLESLHPGSRVLVHPSGVDLSYFKFIDHSRPRAARLVLTGTLGYYPNIDAARWLIDEIMPRLRKIVPEATLTLVGGPVPRELANVDPDSTGVRVVGAVPDVRPFLEEADIFVIPLRLGGGTRLKALEALASGLPIVATSLGIAGVGIQENDLAVIAESTDDFATGIQLALRDRELRARLVHEGRMHVQAHFDWDMIAKDFRAMLLSIAR
jgi:glycosyltransferase involved in cell wall biosynthesis